MAKRHESLLMLAREHHEALLLALRLQQGAQALLKFWSHNPEVQAQRVVDFYEQQLKTHFAEEEQVLFPITGEYLPFTVSIIDNLIAEHRLMESSIIRFRSNRKGSLQNELKSFGKLLEQHVRTEDRTLFPIIEEQVPKEILNEIQIRLEHFANNRQ